MMTRRHMVLGGGLIAGGAAAGLSATRLPRPDAVDLASAFPDAFACWERVVIGIVVLPPETRFSASVYEEVVTRRYGAPGQPLVTVVAAYQGVQTYAAQLHRPEICYPASNFDIGPRRSVPLDAAGGVIPAWQFRARRGDRTDDVLYWTRVGTQFPDSLWAQRRVIGRALLGGQYLDGVVMRLSTTDADAQTARSRLDAFARALAPALDPAAKRLIYGLSP